MGKLPDSHFLTTVNNRRIISSQNDQRKLFTPIGMNALSPITKNTPSSTESCQKYRRIGKSPLLKQLSFVIGASIASLIGGVTTIGCKSTPTAQHSSESLTLSDVEHEEKKHKASIDDIQLTHGLAIRMAMTERVDDLENDWSQEGSPQEEGDFFMNDSSTINIGYESTGYEEITLDIEYHHRYRATDHAVLTRMLDKNGDLKMDIPQFPITLNYHVSTQNNRSWKPLANYEFVNSSRISLDNLFAALLYGIGTRNDLNDKTLYRSASLFLQAAQMLAISRLGHEFAHGYDQTVREKDDLPLSGFLTAVSDSGKEISYEELIASQAAGLNNSSLMALKYWQQAETRGNIVAALGFFISRNDALMQWVYGNSINSGDPEKSHRRKFLFIQKKQHVEQRKTLDDFENEFENKDMETEETLDPAIYQVTGHGDNVAYTKLLEVFGHGNAHRDKDLGIILGTNAFSAYFWQSITEMILFVSQGKQTHERWRLYGPVEWPLFSTYRLPRGYLTQVRIPIVIRNSIINRLNIVGGRDLDNILGDLNTTQVGLEVSGHFTGIFKDIRWSIGSIYSLNRDHWNAQGNIIQGTISYDAGPCTFSLTGTHHQNDPLKKNISLQENGFSVQLGAEIRLGPWKEKMKKEPIPEWRPFEDIPTTLTRSGYETNRVIDIPAPDSNTILSKR